MSIKTAERNSGVLPEDNVIHHRHLVAYNEAVKHINGNVLEIGSGEGYGIKILAPESVKYVAVDKHNTPIDTNSKNIEFYQQSVPPLNQFEDDSFNIVVTFQVIEHIKNDHLFLQEIKRVLKPDGMLIMTTPNKKMSLTRNPWHIREYNLQGMEMLISQYFNSYQINGVFGNEKIMAYYEENRRSVRKFTRFDIFRLQYLLPRKLLQIPYDMANRMNRNKLMKKNTSLVEKVLTSDFFIEKASDNCFDFFVMAHK